MLYSILVPCHNSSANLPTTIYEFNAKIQDDNSEIIFIENGSTDNTLEILQSMKNSNQKFRYMTSEKGLGNALRKGALDAKGSQILVIPDDIPFEMQEIDEAKMNIEQKALFLISKYMEDKKYERSVLRIWMGTYFAHIRELVLKTKVKDSQGTFFGPTEIIQFLLSRSCEKGFLITTEIVYLARKFGITVVEIPANTMKENRSKTTIKMRDLIDMAFGLVRIKFRNY